MYKFYNANPKNEITNDCVIRAISTALDINYYDILELLYENSNYFNCDMLVRQCYEKMLYDEFGLVMFDGINRTVEEIADYFSDYKVIMRTEGHLTCSKFGDIYDIWDTSDEIVDVFWLVEP